jgi:hypothetical protein
MVPSQQASNTQVPVCPLAVTAGALVSGPDVSGSFSDDRTKPEYTSVSLDGNAVLSGLIARGVKPGECNGGRGEHSQRVAVYEGAYD